MWAIGEPTGPMLKGITYIVRPFIDAVELRREQGLHLVGVHPVVGRTGVGFFLAADVGAVLDAGDVARMAAGEEANRAAAPG